MIKIRYPTRKGDIYVTLELSEAREEAHRLQTEGVLLAKEEDREIIKSPKEIKDGDIILAFPRIIGGIDGRRGRVSPFIWFSTCQSR